MPRNVADWLPGEASWASCGKERSQRKNNVCMQDDAPFGAFRCKKPRSKLHRLSHEPIASAAQFKTPWLPEMQDIRSLHSDFVIIVHSRMAGKIGVGM